MKLKETVREIDYPNSKRFTWENANYPHDTSTACIEFHNAPQDNTVEMPQKIAAHIDRFYFFKSFCIGKRVLDVGCGFGYGAKILASVAKSVHAIDLDDNELEFARQYNWSSNTTYECVDVRLLKGFYDTVICTEVIEHIKKEKVAGFVEKLSQLLAPQGLAIFTTPCQKYTQKTGNPYHEIEYSHNDFIAILGKSFDCISGYFYDWRTSTISMRPMCEGILHRQSPIVQIIICKEITRREQ